MLHMFMFGGSGFLMAYGSSPPEPSFLYMHGGIAILVYTVFYLVIFGLDDVKWMFINAGLPRRSLAAPRGSNKNRRPFKGPAVKTVKGFLDYHLLPPP
ncbi:MAG: hypothetical protein A2X35_01665 [Elusimicrobia bacterium GWA2_61_42]|nr:MAG: hypothetical protein A2X35_01665 [Elusimicrobia bacterium GWA2_61_42]OGR76854.1 MAG: hypothetical protein A2X38_11840 [Elusimicrobia bacterium GWC2_61_25]